jgi:hypothetical protein
MSSVHAVTQDLVFTAKVASFYPLDHAQLMKDFSTWIKSKSDDYDIIIYRTTLDYKENKNG